MATARLFVRITLVLFVAHFQQSLATRFPLTYELTSRERNCNTDCSREKTRPVCGNDGQTYNSRCEIRRARCLGNSVQIQHKGECEELSKCQAEQAASRIQAQTSTEGVFVPQCEDDGSFSKIQCHQSFGYCWCVAEDGKPIPGSSVKQGSKANSPLPSCDGEFVPQPNLATFLPNTELPTETKGCNQDARIEFNSNLKDIFREEFHRLPTTQPSSETTGEVQRLEDAQKQVIEWKFTELDSNVDMELDRKELNSLGRMMKKIVKPKKCAKTFVEHCDLDKDGRIAKTEWSFCLVDNNEQPEDPTADGNSQEETHLPIGSNPVTPQPSGATANTGKVVTIISCQAERQRASLKAELFPDSGVFIPQCNADGSYKAVQCHDEAQYCWCVYVDTGRPIPGTSTPASTQQFHCNEMAMSKGSTGIRLFKAHSIKTECVKDLDTPLIITPETKDHKNLLECEGRKKEEFFEILLDRFAAEMSLEDSVADRTSSERLARWKFQQLDVSGNNLLERREYIDFKTEIQKINSAAKKCKRNFMKYCDEDDNLDISMGEWLTCLEVRNGNPSPLPSGSNPFIDRLT